MSKVNLRNAILKALFSAFNEGRYATVQDIKAATSGTDGNTVGVVVEGLIGEQLMAPVAESGEEFGLTEAGIEAAQGLSAPAQVAPVAPAPVAGPSVPQAAAAPAPAGAKKGAKKSAKKSAAKAQDGTFKLSYKRMDTLSAQELATRVEEWTLAAEANAAAGQTIVAEGLMRTVSRAQRRLNNMAKG